MNKESFARMVERLAEDWMSGNEAAPDRIFDHLHMMQPRSLALSLAAELGKYLDEVFDEGAKFRAALREKAGIK